MKVYHNRLGDLNEDIAKRQRVSAKTARYDLNAISEDLIKLPVELRNELRTISDRAMAESYAEARRDGRAKLKELDESIDVEAL